MMMSFVLIAVGLLTLGVSHTVAMPHPRVKRSSGPIPVPAPRWQTRSFSSLSHVEAWLDHLECSGVVERDFSIADDKTFLVRWR